MVAAVRTRVSRRDLLGNDLKLDTQNMVQFPQFPGFPFIANNFGEKVDTGIYIFMH